jgi:AbrB family looped-hinge helix DNA binding protein
MKATARSKITAKGQITIPIEIRRALGVGAGDAVLFCIDEGAVRVLPERASGVAKFKGRFQTGHGRSAAETDRWLSALRGHEDH